MKEELYREILVCNPIKREFSIEEISDDSSEARVAKKWISKYFIKEAFTSDKISDLKKWVKKKQKKICLKNCHILRVLDHQTGENKIVCKILGDIFVIQGNTAYWIVYVNEVKIMLLDILNRDKDALNKRY